MTDCPSTLTHDLSLHGSLSFKQICNKKSVNIEYNRHDREVQRNSDVQLFYNKLVRKSHDNGQYSQENPYSMRQVYMPSLEMRTDLVGDTELISTFIDKYQITDVNWINKGENDFHIDYDHDIYPHGKADISLISKTCGLENTADMRYQCVPPHRHDQLYIWTRHPEAQSRLAM